MFTFVLLAYKNLNFPILPAQEYGSNELSEIRLLTANRKISLRKEKKFIRKINIHINIK